MSYAFYILLNGSISPRMIHKMIHGAKIIFKATVKLN